MDYLPAYKRILKQGGILALATSVNGKPNVRIVNYGCHADDPSVLYFSTSAESGKIAEINENDSAAFTTIPASPDDTPHVRAHSAVVCQSDLSLDDVKGLFLEQSPGLAEMYDMIGGMLTVYEIRVKEADVTVDMDDVGSVSF